MTCWDGVRSQVLGLHIQLVGVGLLVVQWAPQDHAAHAGIDAKGAQHLWGCVLAEAVLDLPIGSLVGIGGCDHHQQCPRQTLCKHGAVVIRIKDNDFDQSGT
uniref:Secreted protein n=1 Tax=Coturnix japonica TaxID=93934 RepID=A0A8C2TGX5_COTJA